MGGGVLPWCGLCGLTFEVTPTAEAGAVRPGRENVHRTSDRPYSACRSGSGVDRGVRPHGCSASCIYRFGSHGTSWTGTARRKVLWTSATASVSASKALTWIGDAVDFTLAR